MELVLAKKIGRKLGLRRKSHLYRKMQMEALLSRFNADHLPQSFEPEFYKLSHPELKRLNEEELRAHYYTIGRKKGLMASPASTREGLVKLLPSFTLMLEIGPLHRPMIKGENVKYADVCSTEELKQKAITNKLDPNGCPNIDFVSRSGDLAKIDMKFGVVLSAHCIEHQPNLIQHLMDVSHILSPKGRYYLVIPDKRYCFDHYLPESTLGDMIDAYYQQPKFHQLRNLINHLTLSCHNDSHRHWLSDHGNVKDQETVVNKAREAIDLYERNREKYIDTHAWQFTPDSFDKIMKALSELNLIPFHPIRIYDTAFRSNEFCAILEKK